MHLGTPLCISWTSIAGIIYKSYELFKPNHLFLHVCCHIVNTWCILSSAKVVRHFEAPYYLLFWLCNVKTISDISFHHKSNITQTSHYMWLVVVFYICICDKDGPRQAGVLRCSAIYIWDRHWYNLPYKWRKEWVTWWWCLSSIWFHNVTIAFVMMIMQKNVQMCHTVDLVLII